MKQSDSPWEEMRCWLLGSFSHSICTWQINCLLKYWFSLVVIWKIVPSAFVFAENQMENNLGFYIMGKGKSPVPKHSWRLDK